MKLVLSTLVTIFITLVLQGVVTWIELNDVGIFLWGVGWDMDEGIIRGIYLRLITFGAACSMASLLICMVSKSYGFLLVGASALFLTLDNFLRTDMSAVKGMSDKAMLYVIYEFQHLIYLPVMLGFCWFYLRVVQREDD